MPRSSCTCSGSMASITSESMAAEAVSQGRAMPSYDLALCVLRVSCYIQSLTRTSRALQISALKGVHQDWHSRRISERTEVASAHSLGMQRCCRNALQRSRLRSRLLRQVLVLSCIIFTPLIATCTQLGKGALNKPAQERLVTQHNSLLCRLWDAMHTDGVL